MRCIVDPFLNQYDQRNFWNPKSAHHGNFRATGKKETGNCKGQVTVAPQSRKGEVTTARDT